MCLFQKTREDIPRQEGSEQALFTGPRLQQKGHLHLSRGPGQHTSLKESPGSLTKRNDHRTVWNHAHMVRWQSLCFATVSGRAAQKTGRAGRLRPCSRYSQSQDAGSLGTCQRRMSQLPERVDVVLTGGSHLNCNQSWEHGL